MKRPVLLPLLATAAMIVVMRVQGGSLVHPPVSPRGIIDLEFVWKETRFNELMAAWERSIVLTNLYLDFLFIAVYTWFFWSVCRALRPRYRYPVVPDAFAWLAVAGGGFDVVENMGLLYRVHGGAGTWALQLAGFAAALKFGLLMLVALFALGSALFRRKPSAATVSPRV